MDETYVIVKGQWVYLYRAVNKFGDTVDFILSEQRDEVPATAFFKQAINNNGFPHKVVMEKSGANYASLENINRLLMLTGLISFIEICQVKYLKNLIEQDHWMGGFPDEKDMNDHGEAVIFNALCSR
jgi:putative transposase